MADATALLHFLSEKLSHEQPRYSLLHRYRRGDHPLPEGDGRWSNLYRQFQKQARTNYCGLVAEAVRERLQVTGFVMGSNPDAQADSDAWTMWQSNQMDAVSALVHDAALTFSVSYVMVGPPAAGSEVPVMTAEDPRTMTILPGRTAQEAPRAALKLWRDPLTPKTELATVYLPDETVTFRRENPYNSTDAWQQVDAQPNTLGVVPVVMFVNRPDVGGTALGEFEDVIDVQRRVNETILHRLVIGKAQAWRQRWVKGIDIPRDADSGDPIPPFRPGVDILWATESDTAQFGDFSEADLRQHLEAVRDDVRDLAAISRTPPTYLLGQVVNASSEALEVAENGLVNKCQDRQLYFGEAWEQVIRLSFAYLNDARSGIVDSETLWADPRRRGLAQLADAVVKYQAAGVPWRQRMILLGYSPTEISRMESERASDELLASLTASPPGDTA